MKTLLFIAAVALIAGGIYHKEVSKYVAGLNMSASRSASATTVVDSIQGMGNSSNALMGGVNNALNR